MGAAASGQRNYRTRQWRNNVHAKRDAKFESMKWKFMDLDDTRDARQEQQPIVVMVRDVNQPRGLNNHLSRGGMPHMMGSHFNGMAGLDGEF